MSYLNTLLRGKAKAAVSGTGSSGQFYDAERKILEKKLGWPHFVGDAQLKRSEKLQQINSITQQVS